LRGPYKPATAAFESLGLILAIQQCETVPPKRRQNLGSVAFHFQLEDHHGEEGLDVPTNGQFPRVRICGESRKKRQSASVRRRQRAGGLDPKAADQIPGMLQRHLETRLIRQALSDFVLDAAVEMIDRYALRAFEAHQRSGCLVLKTIEAESTTFVCSDEPLLEAARSELLTVF
jgi:hypothetical protein